MLNKYIAQTEKQDVISWINTHLKAYIAKHGEDIAEMEHVIDYLNSNKAPKRLKKASYKQMRENSKKWMATQIKKGNHIKELEGDIEIIKSLGNGFNLVQLKGEAAFKREGYIMGHCVASYYNKTDTSVYSLRDKDNNPHCTLEILRNGTEIQQLKGKGNGSIHPDYIKYCFKILDHFEIPLRSSEMSKLGYIELSEDYRQLLIKVYKGVSKNLLTMNNTLFLYKEARLTAYKKYEI